jgi:hypothetical protein
VLRAVDASEELDAGLEASARCPSLPHAEDAPRLWPARCLPVITLGANVVRVPSE